MASLIRRRGITPCKLTIPISTLPCVHSKVRQSSSAALATAPNEIEALQAGEMAEASQSPELLGPSFAGTRFPVAQANKLDSPMSAIALRDRPIRVIGSDIFRSVMKRHGVECIFGNYANFFYGSCGYTQDDFKIINTQHEQGGGHMAQGYSRASGKPGVVVVKSGHGATNLTTPMTDALADGTPLVIVCIQVCRDFIRQGEIQGDILSISQPCTKWNVAVDNPSDLPRRIGEAFEIATNGRPGPVLVMLSHNVMTDISENPPQEPNTTQLAPSKVELALRRMRRLDLMRSIERTARLVNTAKKPVIYAGQGILATGEGPKQLKALADKACIPVTTSLQGLGAFDEMDNRALHMLGLHGSGYANLAIQEADLIIALGARFDDRVTGSVPKFAPKAKLAANQGRGGIVHFDISPKNINKVIEATEAVVGDCGENLGLLLPLVDSKDRPQWMEQIMSWKQEFPLSGFNRHSPDNLVQPQAFIERLNDLVEPFKPRTVLTTGVGQHQMWVAQHFRWRHARSLISSGGLGTMGYGLPAALGAKVARPDALVISIDGDASLSMTINELLTASRYNLNIKLIVLNNEEQGMVTHLQTIYYEKRYCHSHGRNPDFVLAARSMGLQAERCTCPAETDEKLKWLLDSQGPALLEVMTTQKALSLPVVPSGRGLDEFITYNRMVT